MANTLFFQYRCLYKSFIFIDNNTYTVTISINHNIFRREGSHRICNVHHRTAIGLFQIQMRITLAHHHIIRILRLAEHIHQSAPKRIGMITTLMIERMPQSATDMSLGRFIELIHSE